MLSEFIPDFESECYVCGFSPCVEVKNHLMPKTGLCATHFFQVDDSPEWEDWNEKEQPDEEV